MKICIDARNIRQSPSGLCRYAMHIVQGLAKIDQENEYIILRDKRFRKRIVENENFKDVYDPLKDTGSVQNALFGSFVVNPMKVDVFHSLNQVVPYGLKAKRIVTTLHDLMWLEAAHLSLDNPWMARGANLLARTSFAYSYRRADTIISISQATDTIFKHHYPELGHKSTVISHHDVFFLDPTTTERFDLEDLNKELPGQYIFSIGNTKPYKNVDGILKAFAKIAKSKPDLHVVIVGRMDRRPALQSLAAELGVEDRIYFVKQQVSDNDLKLLFKKAAFLAFPSFYEGYGIPILESLSLGCPVLGSTVDVVVETSGGAATYVDPHDIEAMSQRMAKIIDQPDFRDSLVQGGYDYLDSIRDYDSVRMTHETYFDD